MRPGLIDQALLEEQRAWLSRFDDQYLQNWDKLFKDDNEAAMCEAAIRRHLNSQGVLVSPNETIDGSSRAPDFRCQKDGQHFYVEVTCLSIEKVIKSTGINDQPEGASYFSLLTDAVFNACKHKTPQCTSLNAATLVAVGTFHLFASCRYMGKCTCEDLLTGKPKITGVVDSRTGAMIGDSYDSTNLESATFLRPVTCAEGMAHARSPVSGILLYGLGGEPVEVHGILHPSPVLSFDRSMLPEIPFCRLKDGYKAGTLMTEWI